MTIPYDVTSHEDSQVIRWDGLKSDSRGAVLNCELLRPISVSFEGDFDDALASLECSIGKKFFPTIDSTGSVVSAGAECLLRLDRSFLFVCPVIMGGSDKTSVSVSLLCDTIPKRRLGK